MKKIFVAVMAMAAFAACSNEEQIAAPKGQEIAFGDAFVDNATKAIITSSDDLSKFTVWGNVAATGTTNYVALYGTDGATVSRNGKALGAAWDCSLTRYWTPACDYNFVAIANHTGVTVDNGVPTEIKYTVNAETLADLIYSSATANTSTENLVSGSVTGGNIVAFTMKHLLSRVKLSFNNADDTTDDAYSYLIKDISITTWEKGVYTIGAETPWAKEAESNDVTISYPNIANAIVEGATASSDGDQLVIPGSTVNVAFTYELKLNGTTIYTDTVEGTVSGLVAGHAYNVTAQLKQNKKIEFTVTSLETWVDDPATIQ